MRERFLIGLLSLVVVSIASRADDQSFGKASWLDNALRGDIYLLPEDTQHLPDFSKLSPVGTIYTRTLNVLTRDWQEGFPGVTSRFEWFAIEYTGIIRANRAGTYGLMVVSDDGAKVYVDDKLIVDNDGIHPTTSASGTVNLDTNRHTIRIQYFQGPRFELALQLYCTPQGGDQALFPDCNLSIETPAEGHSWWPWLLLVAAIAAVAAWQMRKKPAKVRIVSPEDSIMQVCGRDVTFVAQTIPPGLEANIQWEVPQEQQATVTSGQGLTFTTSWTETGVKQVVAKLHDAGDDVLLFVYKTKTGSLTLGDILDCEPPLASRDPYDYQWYRQRNIPTESKSKETVES